MSIADETPLLRQIYNQCRLRGPRRFLSFSVASALSETCCKSGVCVSETLVALCPHRIHLFHREKAGVYLIVRGEESRREEVFMERD